MVEEMPKNPEGGVPEGKFEAPKPETVEAFFDVCRELVRGITPYSDGNVYKSFDLDVREGDNMGGVDLAMNADSMKSHGVINDFALDIKIPVFDGNVHISISLGEDGIWSEKWVTSSIPSSMRDIAEAKGLAILLEDFLQDDESDSESKYDVADEATEVSDAKLRGLTKFLKTFSQDKAAKEKNQEQ